MNVKGVDFRCIFWGITKDETVNRLNNSVLEDKGVLYIRSECESDIELELRSELKSDTE